MSLLKEKFAGRKLTSVETDEDVLSEAEAGAEATPEMIRHRIEAGDEDGIVGGCQRRTSTPEIVRIRTVGENQASVVSPTLPSESNNRGYCSPEVIRHGLRSTEATEEAQQRCRPISAAEVVRYKVESGGSSGTGSSLIERPLSATSSATGHRQQMSHKNRQVTT